MINTMKKIIYILTLVLMGFFSSCEDGIDPISAVKPGVDEVEPVVSFVSLYVGSDTKNKLGSDVVTFNALDTVTIKFKVVDDIEISSVLVKLNGTEVANYTDFLDYRRFIESVAFNALPLGEYTLTIDVTDKEGKVKNGTLNFKKASPYTRYTANEIAYFPFDGAYQEMVNLGFATPHNGSVFAGVGKLGENSIYNPVGAYVSYPATSLKNTEISGSFWYLPTSTPKKAAIITCGAGLDDFKYGFRLYREGSPSAEALFLSVGNGTSEVKKSMFTLNPKDSVWRHIGFTISATQAVLYVDGVVKNTLALTAPIDWTGCETVAIGSGGSSFSYATDQSKIDELRFFDKALNATEMAEVVNYKGGISAGNEYTPLYDGEVFFMSFDGGDPVDLVAGREVTVVGAPGSSASGKIGDAFAGATDASLEVSMEDWKNSGFSAAFWVNLNAVPDRAGILTVGNPAIIGADNPRLNGFRLFREGTALSQRIKMNVGMGDADAWNDGIDVTALGEWVHVAVSISTDKFTIYVNGVKGSLNNVTNGYAALAAPISWEGCTKIELFTGGSTFAYWNHASDLSLFDELRFFNKALTDDEVKAIYDAEK